MQRNGRPRGVRQTLNNPAHDVDDQCTLSVDAFDLGNLLARPVRRSSRTRRHRSLPEGAHVDIAVGSAQAPIRHQAGTEFTLWLAEAGRVVFRLNPITSYNSVSKAAYGQRGGDFNRRKRMCRKKPTVVAPASQLRTERYEMKVVNPECVGRLSERKNFGEAIVHRTVSIGEVLLEMDEIRPVVKKRPQTLVGEAVVIAIEFFGGQIDGQQIDPVNGLRLRVASRIFSSGLAAPAKPQAAMRRECLRDCDGQSTGLAILSRVGNTWMR